MESRLPVSSLQTWGGTGQWLGHLEGLYREPPRQAEDRLSVVQSTLKSRRPGVSAANIQAGSAGAVFLAPCVTETGKMLSFRQAGPGMHFQADGHLSTDP